MMLCIVHRSSPGPYLLERMAAQRLLSSCCMPRSRFQKIAVAMSDITKNALIDEK